MHICSKGQTLQLSAEVWVGYGWKAYFGPVFGIVFKREENLSSVFSMDRRKKGGTHSLPPTYTQFHPRSPNLTQASAEDHRQGCYIDKVLLRALSENKSVFSCHRTSLRIPEALSFYRILFALSSGMEAW